MSSLFGCARIRKRQIGFDDGIDVLVDFDGDATFVVGERLEGVELRRQQRRGHEMARAAGLPPANHLRRSGEVEEDHVTAVAS
jgi:hypothetical protein